MADDPRKKNLEELKNIWAPCQNILSGILPDFMEQALDDPEVRETIVEAADEALCAKAPEAKLISDGFRKNIIRKLLDLMLDDILLPERKE